MSLNKAQLKAALQAVFEDLDADKTAGQVAQEIADAIDAFVRTGRVTTTANIQSVPYAGTIVGDPSLETGGIS